MEILKVGDELALNGYRAITLSDDMSANIAEFAHVNGVSETEAQRILYTSPALKNFADSLNSVDADEDIILVGDFVDDTEEINAVASFDLATVFGKSGASKKTSSTKTTSTKTTSAKSTSSKKASGTKQASANNEVTKTGASGKPETTFTQNGVSFKIIQNGSSAPSYKTSGKNKVIITGTNIEIQILSCTNKNAIVETNGSNIKLTSTAHVKQIINNAKNSEIIGSAEADDIVNKGEGTTIKGGDGNDTINNTAINAKIYGEAGNDTIKNSGKNVQISGGAGNDTITSSGQNAKIDGDAGADTIKSTGKGSTVNNVEAEDNVTRNNNTTVNMKTGNIQTITVAGITFKVQAKVASSKFTYKESTKTVKINGKNTKVPLITITANNCKIEIAQASNSNSRIVLKGSDNELKSTAKVGEILNQDHTATIIGSDEDDNIINQGNYAIIDAGAGNDTITNKSSGFGATILGGIGSDTITNQASSKKVKGTEYHVTISGGSGNDKITNTGKNATIDVKDGDDEVNINANVQTNITGWSDGDVLNLKKGVSESKISRSLFTSSVQPGQIGSIEYAIARIEGLSRSDVEEYETDSQGRVVALYLDNKGSNVYRISYNDITVLASSNCIALPSNLGMTITHEENHELKWQESFNSSGNRVYRYEHSVTNDGEVNTSTMYDDQGNITSQVITGTTMNGSSAQQRYTLFNNSANQNYPKVNATATQLIITFKADANGAEKTITIQDGENVEVSATTNGEFTVVVTKTDGSYEKYNSLGVKIQQGGTAIGSAEYLHGLDGTLDMDSATDIQYDAQGRISSFRIASYDYTVTYNGGTIIINKKNTSDPQHAICGAWSDTTKVFENGKLAKKTVISGGTSSPGSLLQQCITETLYNTSTGAVTKETKTVEYKDASGNVTGTVTTVSSNYTNGVPASVVTTGTTGNVENYTITDNYASNDYPKFTNGNATSGTIGFSATKSITIPLTEGATNVEAVIGTNGKVTVTETLANGETKVTKYDKKGNIEGAPEVTDTDHHEVDGGSYDHSTTTVGQTTIHTYEGHTDAGADTFVIRGLNTSVVSARVNVVNATTAQIIYANHTITINSGDVAEFASNGKLTVKRKNGNEEVYRVNGSMESKKTVKGNTTTIELYSADDKLSQKTVVVKKADNSTETTVITYKADGVSKESETVTKKDAAGHTTYENIKANFNDDGSYTETIKGFKDNKQYYAVTYLNNGSEYPKFDPSSNGQSLQVKLSASASFSITNGSSVTISNDGKTAVVKQTNGVIITYTLDNNGQLHQTVEKPDTPEIVLPQDSGEDTNTNTNKNILGMFGLSADIQITEGPTERTVTEENIYGETVNVKIIQIKANGKTYVAKLDATTGELLETKENGTVKYQKEVDQVKLKTHQIAVKKQELVSLIRDYLNSRLMRGEQYTEAVVREVVTQILDDLKNNKLVYPLRTEILNRFADRGFDIYDLRRQMENQSQDGQRMLALFADLNTLIAEKNAAEAAEAAKTNKVVTKTVNGLSFKIDYPKTATEPTITYNSSTKTYTISGSNCKVEVLGYGEKNDVNIVLANGSNIEFSSKYTRFASITNKVEGATINGSSGNDNIINEAANAKINAGEGNDTISNSGANVTVDAGAGKDNITNTGANARIDAGSGNDIITNSGNGSTISSGAGDDIVRNTGNNVTINGNAGNDQIENRGANATIKGNDGDDKIINYGSNANIEGNTGNDTIYYVNGTVSSMDAEHKHVFLADSNHWQDNDPLSGCTPINVSVGTPVEDNPVEDSPIEDDPIEDTPIVTPVNPGDSDDSNYTYMQSFTRNGVTFTFYSNTEITQDPSSLSGDVVIINSSNSKVVVTANTNSKASVRIEGSHVDFSTNVKLATVFNYADHSKLTGSDDKDWIFNYADDVEIAGGKGDDHLYTAGSNVSVNGNDGADTIEIRKGTNVKVVTDASDNYTDKTGNAQCEGPGCHVTEPATADTVKTYLKNSSVKSALGLSDSDLSTFISHYYGKNGYTTYEKVLELVKQIEVIYENSDKDSQTKASIKACMTGSATFNNEILADAAIVLKAKEAGSVGSSAYNASIKSQMIKNGKSNASVGDVYKENGKLYYRTGTGANDFVQLNISEDTYIELFQPVKRFIVEQNNNADCFLLSSALVDCMENTTARATILQMFKEDSNGNITVTIPGVSSYPVTFENGNLKTDSNIVSSAKGLQMLEQAYALAKFAEVTNSTLSIEDISALHSSQLATAVNAARSNSSLKNDINYAMKFYVGGWFTGNGNYTPENYNKTFSVRGVLNDLFPNTSSSDYNTVGITENNLNIIARYINSGNYVITTTCPQVSEEDAARYNLSAQEAHQLSIERIDTTNKMIYLRNPWDSYRLTAISYAEFQRLFSSIDFRKLS